MAGSIFARARFENPGKSVAVPKQKDGDYRHRRSGESQSNIGVKRLACHIAEACRADQLESVKSGLAISRTKFDKQMPRLTKQPL